MKLVIRFVPGHSLILLLVCCVRLCSHTCPQGPVDTCWPPCRCLRTRRRSWLSWSLGAEAPYPGHQSHSLLCRLSSLEIYTVFPSQRPCRRGSRSPPQLRVNANLISDPTVQILLRFWLWSLIKSVPPLLGLKVKHNFIMKNKTTEAKVLPWGCGRKVGSSVRQGEGVSQNQTGRRSVWMAAFPLTRDSLWEEYQKNWCGGSCLGSQHSGS